MILTPPPSQNILPIRLHPSLLSSLSTNEELVTSRLKGQLFNVAFWRKGQCMIIKYYILCKIIFSAVVRGRDLEVIKIDLKALAVGYFSLLVYCCFSRSMTSITSIFFTDIIIIIIIMEKTEAGLERPLYPRNRCRITNTCYTIL